MSLDAPHEQDSPRARLWATREVLGAHGLAAEIAESEPLMVVAGPRSVPLRCRRRWSDGGRLWLYAAMGEPTAPADDEHVHEVITWVKQQVHGEEKTSNPSRDGRAWETGGVSDGPH